MLSLRGPLCAGEAFSLRPRGRGGHCKPWRDVGPRKELVPRPFTPHISTVLATPKRGATVSRTGHTELILSCALITAVTLGTCGSKEARSIAADVVGDDCGKDPRCRRGLAGWVPKRVLVCTI